MGGHGLRRDNFYNPEGYADPTAGCAINGNCEIYAAPLRRRPGEKEKVIDVQLPEVSELVAFLVELGYSIRQEEGIICAGKRWKAEKSAGNKAETGIDAGFSETETRG